MLIRVDDENNIIGVITSGGFPENTPGYYKITESDITDEILQNIYNYKYINNEFILNNNTVEDKISDLKSQKIANLRKICNQIIEYGIDVNGKHYSLSAEDQMNLTNLSMLAKTGIEKIPYHADGELCRLFTATEIGEIAETAIMWITFHTTYYNFMKSYLSSIDDADIIKNFQYDMNLPDDYMIQIMSIVGNIDITKFNIPLIQDDPAQYDQILYTSSDLTKSNIDFSAADFINPQETITTDETGEQYDYTDETEEDYPISDP